jgi:hypothetical protein
MNTLNIKNHVLTFKESKLELLNTFRIVKSIYDTDQEVLNINDNFPLNGLFIGKYELLTINELNTHIETWMYCELHIHHAKKTDFDSLDDFVFYVFMYDKNEREYIIKQGIDINLEKIRLPIFEIDEQFEWGYYKTELITILRHFNKGYEYGYLYAEEHPRLIGFQKNGEYWAFNYMAYT